MEPKGGENPLASGEEPRRELTTEPLSPAMADIRPPEPPHVESIESPVHISGSFDHPTQIGRYHILETLGEGGMGVVYKAEQRHPVRRIVALKLVKLGMDSRTVIARFEAERQVLALMSHTNVARVFDAGITDTGRPFFVMEYVSGEPITSYCDRHRLSTRRRLELFRQACDAVHHAHQKAIIHRDIKPSNVLVCVQDGHPVVKVIDFGVAKALHQRLTEHTLFTEQGQVIGTPEYMSPEQAEMNVLDIDIRTDVYSLGVLLYELLTGALPFDSKSVRAGAFLEMQKLIREVDPPRPSTRLSQLGEQGDRIASNRSTDIISLGRELHGELEWVPLKAMRKDRTERYRSASELSDDIDNYLHYRPLIAGPQTPTYRVRKFARKHRRAVSVAATLFLAFLALGTALAITARRAVVARNAAAEKQNLWEQEAKRALGAEKIANEARQAATEANLQIGKEKERAQELLADLFEGKAQTELEASRIEPALVYLSEAYQLVPDRKSVRFHLAHAFRLLNAGTLLERRGVLAWKASESYADFHFSPDDSRILASESGSCTLWNPADGRLIKHFPNHYFQQYSHDGRFFLLARQRIHLFLSADGSEVASFDGSAAALSPDGQLLLTAEESGLYRLYDLTSRKLISRVRLDNPQLRNRVIGRLNHTDMYGGFEVKLRPRPGETWRQLALRIRNLVAFSGNGKRLLTLGTAQNGVHLWEISTGNFLASIQPARGVIIAAALDEEGTHLATLRFQLPGEGPAQFSTSPPAAHPHITTSAAIPSSAPSITSPAPSAPMQLVLELWPLQNPSTPKELHRSDTRASGSQSVGTDAYVTYGYQDPTLRIVKEKILFHFGTSRPLHTWRTNGATLSTLEAAAAVSNDGKWALGGGRESPTSRGRWGLWDIERGKLEDASEVQMTSIIDAAFKPNGRGAYTLESDGTIILWAAPYPCATHANTPDAHLILRREHALVLPGRSTVSPNAKLVVSKQPDGLVLVGNPEHPPDGRRIRFDRGGMLQLSPDRRLALLRDSSSEQLHLQDLKSGVVLTISDSANLVLPRPHNPAFSPDGSRLLLVSKTGPATISIVDTATASFIARFSADTTELIAPVVEDRDQLLVGEKNNVAPRLIFSPNSKLLALLDPSSNRRAAKVIHLATGEPLTTISCPEDINFASFVPDASMILFSTKSGVIGFDTRSGVSRVTLPTGPATGAWTNSSGSRLLVVTSGEDRDRENALQLWDTSKFERIATFKGGTGADFSPDGTRLINGQSQSNRLPWIPVRYTFSTYGLFDAISGKQLAELTNASGAEFSNDSSLLLTASHSKGLDLWHARDGTLYCHISGERESSLHQAELSSDNSMVLIHDSGSHPKLWSIPDGRPIGRVPTTYGVKFANDRLALIDNRGVLEIALETRDPKSIRSWVQAAISLRTSGLDIVKSDPRQQWLAEYRLRRDTLGHDHPHTTETLLSMISAKDPWADAGQFASVIKELADDASLTSKALPAEAVNALPAAIRSAIEGKRFDAAESLARSALKLRVLLHGEASKESMAARVLLNTVLAKSRSASATTLPSATVQVNDVDQPEWFRDSQLSATGTVAHIQLPVGANRSTYIFFSDAPRSRFYAKMSPNVFKELSARMQGDPFTALCGARVRVRGFFNSNQDGPFVTLADAQHLEVLQPPVAFLPNPPFTKFWFDYLPADNPGYRRWKRIDADTWEESYPDGRISRFKQTSVVQEGLYQRTILRRQKDDKYDDNFEVFIPPPVDGAWFQYRRPGAPEWINLARIQLSEQ